VEPKAYRSAKHRALIKLSLCGLGFLTGGCSLGPDFVKPVVDVPKILDHQAGRAQVHKAASTQPIDPQWWKIYRDPILMRLEEEVAASNLDLKAAVYRFDQSRATRTIIGAAQYPTSNANASYARERASTNGVLNLLGNLNQEQASQISNGTNEFTPAALPGEAGNAFNLFQYGIDASWEVDLWGRVRRSVESAEANVEANEDMLRDVVISLQAETARDYIQLRAVQAHIAITRENLAIAKHGLDLTHMRFTNGATTTLDVANATAQVATIEAQLPELEEAEERLINAMSFLVAAEPRALKGRLGVRKEIPVAPGRIPMGLPSELAERRPDIRVAEDQLHAATANIGVAQADFYPRVTLSGSLAIQALTFSGLGTWASHQYGLGPTVTMPIFEGGRLHGALELREDQQKEAAVHFQRTVLKAWHEIDDALTAYHASIVARAKFAEATKQNKIALDAAQTQYAQGSSDYLNVLIVQNRLLATQSRYVQASGQAALAVTQLYKTLGGGWETRFPVRPMPPQ